MVEVLGGCWNNRFSTIEHIVLGVVCASNDIL